MSNLEKLKENNMRGNEFKHYIQNITILPFRTQHRDQTDYDTGFDGIVGEFSRIICNKQFKTDNENGLGIDGFLNEIYASNDLKIDSEDFNDFKNFLKFYLTKEGSDNNINILHPKLFLYLKKNPPKKNKNGTYRYDYERGLALFIRDIFFRDTTDFNTFFENEESDNIIIKFILNHIDRFDNIDSPIEKKFEPILKYVIDVFKEDLDFIRKFPDFLVKNLSNFLLFYYVFYCTQMVLKLNDGFSVDLKKPTKIYYLLDDEKVNKSRRTLKEGYKNYKEINQVSIEEANKNSFLNIVLLSELNMLAGTENKLLPEIREKINRKEINENELIHSLKEWIKFYEDKHNLTKNHYEDSINDFTELVKILKNDLNDKGGINHRTSESYMINLDKILQLYFAKLRGMYGYVLNLTNDFLYLITALCIKEEKIKLKVLFERYEKRGLCFDAESRRKVVEMLNKWNLIEKKSDSGDAQYVKRILY